jgi:hypothetical protein
MWMMGAISPTNCQEELIAVMCATGAGWRDRVPRATALPASPPTQTAPVESDYLARGAGTIGFVTERSSDGGAPGSSSWGEGESRQRQPGTDMLTNAFAESTRAPRPAAAAYAGPGDGRLLSVVAGARRTNKSGSPTR